MGQQHGGQTLVMLGLMLFEPENLRCREAGQHGIAQQPDGLFLAPEPFHDLFAFGGGGGVTPQFGRADHLAVLVQRDEPVLLAADPDGLDLGSRGLGLTQRPPNRRRGGVTPGVRVLFLGAGGQVGQEVVLLGGGGQDAAVAGVNDQRLGGLRAAVHTNNQCSHNRPY